MFLKTSQFLYCPGNNLERKCAVMVWDIVERVLFLACLFLMLAQPLTSKHFPLLDVSLQQQKKGQWADFWVVFRMQSPMIWAELHQQNQGTCFVKPEVVRVLTWSRPVRGQDGWSLHTCPLDGFPSTPNRTHWKEVSWTNTDQYQRFLKCNPQSHLGGGWGWS